MSDFETELARVISVDSSWYDEEMGSVDELGWYAYALNVTRDDMERALRECDVAFELGDLTSYVNKHLLIRFDSNGFGYVTVYDKEACLMEDWDGIVADYAELYGDESKED